MLLKILIIFFLLVTPAWATDWCDDGNAKICYQIEEGSGTTLDDESSNANDITFGSSYEPAWSADVPDLVTDGFGGSSSWSLSFNNDWMDTDSAGVFSGTGNHSQVMWIKTSQSLSNAHVTNIGPAVNNDMTLVVFKTGTIAYGTWGDSAQTTTTINDGTWKHIAKTWNGSVFDIYIDGTSDETDGSGTPDIVDQVAHFGSYVGLPTNASFAYTGYMDELAFFDDELSGTDINDILDNGLVQAAGTATETTIVGATIYSAVINE